MVQLVEPVGGVHHVEPLAFLNVTHPLYDPTQDFVPVPGRKGPETAVLVPVITKSLALEG